MKIGFFGDSFCSVCDFPQYETYIKKLKVHYKAEIVNLGIVGSSIYDSILMQFKPFFLSNNVPDICIFCWTGYQRIFDREKRNITVQTSDKFYSEVYKKLYDNELAQLNYYTTIKFFDEEILNNIESKKFIHIFCFSDTFEIYGKNIKYIFKNGMTIKPFFYDVAQIFPNAFLTNGSANSIAEKFFGILPSLKDANHIIGDYKNNFYYEIIKSAIDTYKSGTTVENIFVNKSDERYKIKFKGD